MLRSVDMNTNENSLTALDQIAVALDVLLALMLLVVPFVLTPDFERLFSDFGSEESLPYVTQLIMKPWLLIACAIPVLVLVVLGLVWKRSIFQRRLMITTSFVIGAISTAFYCYGLYAPFLALAGALQE